MRAALLATLLAGVVVAAGCGGSPSPEDTASAAVSGLAEGDGKKVCSRFTAAARAKLLAVLADDPPLVRPVKAATCEEAISKVHAQLSEPLRAVLRDGEVDEAKVDGDRAVVHVTGAGVDLQLLRVADEWKITDGLFKR